MFRSMHIKLRGEKAVLWKNNSFICRDRLCFPKRTEITACSVQVNKTTPDITQWTITVWWSTTRWRLIAFYEGRNTWGDLFRISGCLAVTTSLRPLWRDRSRSRDACFCPRCPEWRRLQRPPATLCRSHIWQNCGFSRATKSPATKDSDLPQILDAIGIHNTHLLHHS